MRVNNQYGVFNIFKAMEYPTSTNGNFIVNIIKQTVIDVQERSHFLDPLEHILTSKDIEEEDKELM